MKNYVVSARKYRPSTFASVVGQKALTVTLKNAIATERLAHAYLFCGSRGVGKTSCARIFAKTINCTHRTPDGEACNECDSCKSFNNNVSLNIIELDAASHNGVDDMRALIEQVLVPPTLGRYRVFIIDEVHMLSSQAFNAFLKTLEEPPEHVIFILATTEKHKIIPTILSRCQIYDFSRISISDMVDHLAYVASQEGITADRQALNVIAQQADGAMRDALSIFDQVAASSLGNISYQSTIESLNILDYKYYARVFEAMLTEDVPSALLVYKEVRDKGFDSQFFINGLASYLRNLMVARDTQTLQLLDASDEEKRQLAELAAKCKPRMLYQAMNLCNEADLNFRQASNKQFLIELTLIKLCQLLSPSASSGNAEGQLKPIAAMHAELSGHPEEGTSPVAPQVATPGQPAPSKPHPASPPTAQLVNQSNEHSSTADADAAKTATATAPIHTPRISITRIHGMENNAPDTTLTSAPAKPQRAEAYTDDAVKVAWEAYINSHPSAKIVINIMRNSLPRRNEPQTHDFMVVVANDVQMTNLKGVMPELLTHMRNYLRNDLFNINIAVDNSEIPAYAWNERQVLDYMIEKHKSVDDFVKQFKLTLL